MNTNKLTTILAVVATAAVVAAAAPLFASAQTVPTISSISPSTVNTGTGAFTMTVNGTGFVSGSTVNINGSVFPATYLSSNQLTVSVPSSSVASTGTYPVSVTNAGYGTSNTQYLTVTNSGSPAITSISPMYEATGSGDTTVTINGSGFASGSTVAFNGTNLAVNYVSGNELQVTVPASDMAFSGSYNLSVTTPGVGTSNSTPFTVYTNTTPSVSSISPASGVANSGNTNITVNGNGFNPNSTITFNGTTLPTTYISPTELTAAIPAANMSSQGTYNVGVSNSGFSPSNTIGFTVGAGTTPFVTSVSPSEVTMGAGSTQITVMGSGFMNGSTISFAGSPLTTSYVSPNELTAFVPSTLLVSSEYAPVNVTNSGIGTSNSILFTVAGAASGTPSLPDTGFAPQSAFSAGAAAAAVLAAMAAVAVINRKKLFAR